MGCMANCEEGRAGGCHDLPLIWAGCRESWEKSVGGWNWLCGWLAPEELEDHDEEMGMEEASVIERPIVRPPGAA